MWLTNIADALQNPTHPSCGDCIYSDFRGDNGAPGPQVCKKKFEFIKIAGYSYKAISYK